MNFVLTFLLFVLPSCPTEDSRNCGWNAETQGNLDGSSFADIMGVTFK